MKVIDKFLASKFVLAQELAQGDTFLVQDQLFMRLPMTEEAVVVDSVHLETGQVVPHKFDEKVLPVKVEVHMVDIGK